MGIERDKIDAVEQLHVEMKGILDDIESAYDTLVTKEENLVTATEERDQAKSVLESEIESYRKKSLALAAAVGSAGLGEKGNDGEGDSE